MKTLKHVLLVTSLALIPAFSSALGQVKVSDTDKDFIKQTSLKQVFLVIASNLAPTHSNSPLVQRLARRLVRDNLTDYGSLASLGLRIDVAVSSSGDQESNSTYVQLLTLAGNEFDQLFVRTAAQLLKEAIQDDYKSEIKNGSNPATKLYAVRTFRRVVTDHQLTVLTANQTGIKLN